MFDLVQITNEIEWTVPEMLHAQRAQTLQQMAQRLWDEREAWPDAMSFASGLVAGWAAGEGIMVEVKRTGEVRDGT